MINICDLSFDGPFLLSGEYVLDRSGVYVILKKVNTNLKNGVYSPVYVGESSQIQTRLANHERKICWLRHSPEDQLYVAVFYTPGNYYSEQDRLKIESRIIEHHNPPCNRM